MPTEDNAPIFVDLGCGMARVDRSFVKKLTVGFQKIEASLTIMEPATYEENFYIPADSMQICGNEKLKKLRDALTEALGE